MSACREGGSDVTGFCLSGVMSGVVLLLTKLFYISKRHVFLLCSLELGF